MQMELGLLQAVVGAGLIVIIAIVVVVVLILASAVRIVKEYERGVVFRLGRVLGRPKGPGLILLIPFVDRMVKIELRTVSMGVPSQEVITQDNVPARVDAVLYFRVVDPTRSVIEVADYSFATSQISQTTLRSVLGQKDLDDLLTNREAINAELQKIIDEHTEPWGIKVSAVEVKDVEIPSQMQRAMARQAESERDRRAKIINAEGEFQASQRLRQAADRLESPTALQLRLFQTLTEISSEQSSTIILPVPLEMVRPFMDIADGHRSFKKPPEVEKKEEEQAERLYEEAVGERKVKEETT